MKLLIFALLVVLSLARTYPMYKQCDSRWGSEHLGTSSNTICQAGCLMSSASMALAGTGHSYNPGTLNTWLKEHGGYVSGDLFVWTAIDKLGLTYKGKISNTEIKKHLDSGFVVILNVHAGKHWVLAHGYSGENILVNDPGFSTNSYPLSEIVNGNTAIYEVAKMPAYWSELFGQFKETVYGWFGIQEEVVVQERIEGIEQITVI